MKLIDGKLVRLTAQEKASIKRDQTLLAAAQAKTKWLRDRQAAYAQLNQDEMRYDDLINGTTIWQDTITAIKAKYPKPL